MPYKVWLADDERWILESLKRMMDWADHGYEIIGESYNGLDAYEQISQHRPDVAFIDIRMPGLSGIELIRKLHEDELGIHFVIASGYAEFEYAKQAMSYGTAGYCLKPFNIDEIAQVLLSLKHRLQRESHAVLPDPCMDGGAADGNGEDTLRSIEHYIREHFQEPLTVQDIARRFYLHPNYLSSLFKRELGVNFTKFLNDIRMGHARRLLANSRLTVSDVAERAGYKDYFYFARMFKRHAGMTPTEYRADPTRTESGDA